jgi:hypothetical protein
MKILMISRSGGRALGVIALWALLGALFILVVPSARAGILDTVAGPPPAIDPGPRVNYVVTVYDSASRSPLELVRVALVRGKSAVATATTNAAGRASFRDIQPGRYLLYARFAGFHSFSDTVEIDSSHTADTVVMGELVTREVVIRADREDAMQHIATSVDTKTGNQVFEGETYHAPPAARMTQLVQQNVAGASRAPTGEVHVRGQHGEFTYYVDGIPIPLGVFGGLNEVVDPKVIDRATFYTGGFPAEYGGDMAAIIDVQNRVPAGRFHLDLATYAGSYLTSADNGPADLAGAFRRLNSNGESLSLSNNVGDLGFFLSGARQETDRRIDQPTPELFHDHGFDYFLYGKAHYILGERDYLTTNLNYSLTQTEVPYDPATQIRNDLQRSYNAFQTLSYFHTFSLENDHESNFFTGIYAREGGLKFTPGLDDQPKQYLGSDTTHGYVVDEDRRFLTLGIRSKYDIELSHQLAVTAGGSFSTTMGTEDFRFVSTDVEGPHTLSNFSGSDFGLFVQSQWHPVEWGRFDLGIRYDRHIAPDVAMQSQFSPRIKLNFFLDEFNSLYFYYGRLFMPTNIEGLRSFATQVGDSASGTLPERDHFIEGVYSRNWEFGLTSKFAAFYKRATPGLDDETLGSSSIKVPVNIEVVRTAGIELSLAYSHPEIPLSAYANASVIHTYGEGGVSGGFLAPDSSSGPFDLDHDQRLALVLGVNYQTRRWFTNLSANYGSGLTNGNEDLQFKTGLFDLNQSGHTTPAWILDLAAGYTFDLGETQRLEPSIYITNLLDHSHLIKGAFFSGASFEERRNVVLKLSYRM